MFGRRDLISGDHRHPRGVCFKVNRKVMVRSAFFWFRQFGQGEAQASMKFIKAKLADSDAKYFHIRISRVSTKFVGVRADIG